MNESEGGEIQQINDELPNGLGETSYLNVDEEWLGLSERLGRPKICKNVFYPAVHSWIAENFSADPDKFSYFEAGCGHGNDLRAFRSNLATKGRYLGVDMSVAEINHGLEYYHEESGEDTNVARNWFVQGDLRDLKQVNAWDSANESFTKPIALNDNEFDVVYFASVLHGLGYGQSTFHEKQAAAQQMLNELTRISKPGGRLFGLANVFGSGISQDEQIDYMRATNNWRFNPSVELVREMIQQAGHRIINDDVRTDRVLKEKADRKDLYRYSFLAEKIGE